ncbi:MAG: YdcF family protein [Clostridium sp.]|uniref:YdcF family protein n=1 Tax=Clostridium chrysemydis TaxID=2665504 RepID=UPI003EE5D7DF
MFIILVIACIITGIILYKEPRDFIVGSIFTLSTLGVFLYLLAFLASAISILKAPLVIIVFIGAPLAVIFFCVFLIKNGKIMRLKEGRHLANRLSLIFGVYIIFVISVTLALLFYGEHMNKIIFKVLLLIVILSVYFGIILFIYLAYSYLYQRIHFKKKSEFIIVLGAGLNKDKVTPLLKSRLDKGIEMYNIQKNNKVEAKIIVSGGQGEDELVSEAFAMKEYLLSQNILKEDIIMEDKSKTTYENMKFSKDIMDSLKDNYNSIFVSNNYHVFRAAIYSRKAKLKAYGVGAPTSFYFLPSALIREYIAILFIYKRINILVTLGLTFLMFLLN